MIDASICDNLAALRQGTELLSRMPPEKFTRRMPACFNSSVGGHMRHVIEHYVSLIDGMKAGEIDYEARARDPSTETDPSCAMARLVEIGRRLEEMTVDRELAVRMESSANPAWGRSSLARELEFLLSHTVHHYALVGVICQLDGTAVPKNFGMAPSTLRHLQSQSRTAACAR